MKILGHVRKYMKEGGAPLVRRAKGARAFLYPVDEKVKKRHGTIYAAAVKGDWGKVEEIYKNFPDDVRAKLESSYLGDTALHVVAAVGRNEFVKQLVSKYLKDEDLEMKNEKGNTAFCLAAMTGNMELVRFIYVSKENGITIDP
ncbi:hypothetical protein Ddye_028045 [Dipteronia dyeriana]|uniref:Uncharacterized protein n=1 Tax=Dipteronia dyeriana TaxID=168575 RepID=A0AAD9TQ87_9ROSI|nr:hypothetical protein Ddye_028045 [Dipteronia dyeriana]